MATLKERYTKEITPVLMKELNLSNVMEVPSLEKIVINSGIGGFRDKKEAVEVFVEELSLITGQKPLPRKARLSESGFKIRAGDVVGYAATLRGAQMWAFLDKLISIVIPRIRDFRGLNKSSFDNAGNYSFGINEHTIFPEVNANTTKGIRDLQVTIVTNAKNKEESEKLLSLLGVPFKK